MATTLVGRLHAHANQHGIDAFTFDDFVFVGGKVSRDPERLVLVGGQALETWGVVLDCPAPLGDGTPLTEDADWLGSKTDAKWLCDMLGAGQHELYLAKDFEEGANTGVAFIERPDKRVLMMDFLRAIVGPTNEQVRRLAVPLSFRGITVQVLHPLLCLHSRLSNLAVIPSKRRGNGPMQAVWAVKIAGAFIQKLLSDGDTRQAIRACHKVADLAASRHGKYCYTHFEVDPLLAISDEIVKTIGGQFETEDWPRTQARVLERRARTAAHLARLKAEKKTPQP